MPRSSTNCMTTVFARCGKIRQKRFHAAAPRLGNVIQILFIGVIKMKKSMFYIHHYLTLIVGFLLGVNSSSFFEYTDSVRIIVNILMYVSLFALIGFSTKINKYFRNK